MKLKDVDTLFLRIFVLLIAAFMASSLLAFEVFQVTVPHPPWTQSASDGRPTMPGAAASASPSDSSFQRSLPASVRHRRLLGFGFDAIIKLVAGALAAWLAARTLSLPMRRLSDAARELRQSLSPAARVGVAAPPQLDEVRGTREVRETAQVFNGLARQLKTDYDTQRLMLATVSHDLRTPLTRLRMRLSELEQHPAAQRAIDDVRQMDELIEGLLALFRPPAAAPAGGDQRIDAFALVQAIVDDLPANGPPVTLTGEPTSTRCPPAALRRMVDNLLENAVRHGGPHNGVDLSVTADDECVEVRIADRGPGLSVEQLESAGTPFLRWVGVEQDDQRRAGLGLGLYITRALAEREGGSLRLTARDGGGLVATLSLPIAR